jgi:hypothetical protein
MMQQLYFVIGTLLLATTTNAVIGEKNVAKLSSWSLLKKLHQHNSLVPRQLILRSVRGGADFVGNDDANVEYNDAASTMAASIFKVGGGLGINSNNNAKGGWFGKILKGGASSSGDSNNIIDANGGVVGGEIMMNNGILKPPLLRPPPPPPPPPLGDVNAEATVSSQGGQSPPWLQQQNQQQNQQQLQQRLTPQQQQQYQQQYQQYQQQQQLPGNPYYYPNNNNYNNNRNTNSNYNNRLLALDTTSNTNNNNEEYQRILNELDESTIREMTYMNQIQNMSSYIDTITQETNYLSNKVDILVERLADPTSNYHYVKNQNIELSNNCTSLTTIIESLQSEIKELMNTNIQLQEQNDEYEHVIIIKLRSELHRTTDTLERLSCLVENE